MQKQNTVVAAGIADGCQQFHKSRSQIRRHRRQIGLIRIAVKNGAGSEYFSKRIDIIEIALVIPVEDDAVSIEVRGPGGDFRSIFDNSGIDETSTVAPGDFRFNIEDNVSKIGIQRIGDQSPVVVIEKSDGFGRNFALHKCTASMPAHQNVVLHHLADRPPDAGARSVEQTT